MTSGARRGSEESHPDDHALSRAFDAWAGNAPSGRFDELRGRAGTPAAVATRSVGAAAGRVSEAWERFLLAECPRTAPAEQAAALAAKLDRVHAAVQREVHVNGMTYNVHSAQAGQQRPWSLDALPWIVGSDDWALIERGVLQRAALLNRLMADVYSEQISLRRGLMPSALVHGHPGYLRALKGWQPRAGSWLQLMAFDITRQPDGRWAVVSQRVQAPSGLGYLLENRMIVSRQFPAAFASLRVQRMAGAYRAWMDHLYRLSPEGERSQVVLLTPGPYSETYFEHAFLARYLGIPLVEGADLMVRHERVYLKAVHGLEAVHGILRRLDDDYCDPLELRADSTLGVPGLVQAVRAGKVAVFNGLGAGFLESPALTGFLPGLCEHWMGEPLQLPGLDTWWCGEEASRLGVLPSLHQCVVKPTSPLVPVEPQPLHDASAADLAALRERIEAAPEGYTAQRYSPFSAVPVWREPSARAAAAPAASAATESGSLHRLDLRPALLRVYALADGPQSWRVLPGGLGRTAAPGRELVSMQRGGSSVDVWVRTQAAVDHSTLLPAALTVADLQQRQRPTTSRAAENLFWLGRYTERAENAVRLAREVLEWLAARSHRFAAAQEDLHTAWPRLAAMLSDWSRRFGLVNDSVPSLAQSQRLFERAMVADLFDPQAGSLAFNLACLQSCAQQVRDRLSREHWRLVDEGVASLGSPGLTGPGAASPRAAEVLAWLDDTASRLAAITGAQIDRMTRDDGWRMLSLGRQIERTQFVCGVLEGALRHDLLPRDPPVLDAAQPRTLNEESEAMFDLLLGVCDCRITYRSVYQRRLELLPMLDLLVKDTDNPRSLAWVARTLANRVGRLASKDAERTPSGLMACWRRWPDLDALPLETLASWWYTPVAPPSGDGLPAAALSELEAWLAGLSAAAAEVSDEISQRFFSHASGSALDEVEAGS